MCRGGVIIFYLACDAPVIGQHPLPLPPPPALQIGGNNALNNARATIVAINQLRTFKEVALDRGLTVEELWA